MTTSKNLYSLFLLLAICFLIACPLDFDFGSSDDDDDGGNNGGGGNVELPEFTDVVDDALIGDVGLLGRTAAWGDFNGDGCQDLIVGNSDFGGSSINVFLFKNNCDGTFTDVTMESGIVDDVPINSAAWADFDNDGFLDLVIGSNFAAAPAILYKNIEGTVFLDVSEDAGITESSGVTGHTLWADYDGDGLVDLLQVTSVQSLLYHNEGDGTFTEVSEESGIEPDPSSSAIWFDFNNDGFPDLFFANEASTNTLYVNNGDGTFTDVTGDSDVGGDSDWDSVASCVGDYNNDGFLDIYVVNIFLDAPVTNVLYENNGDGTFTDVTLDTDTGDAGDGRTCAWVDFDADGRIDLFTTNHLNQNRLFRNRGNNNFTEVAEDVGLDSPIDVFGAPWGDYNNDGFMDAFLNGHIGEALMENSGNSNNFIIIELVGDSDSTNISAIGTRVEVTTSEGGQIREVSGGKGCCEQDMLPLHFGIGEETSADIQVEWTSGETCLFNDVSIGNGKRFIISEGGCDLTTL